MRTESARSLKRTLVGAASHDKPREGSKLRILYDILMDNKGKPVDINASKIAYKTAVIQLTDYYGLDIRCTHRGRAVKYATYILAGEWFGSVYVDYVAQRMEQLEKEQSK